MDKIIRSFCAICAKHLPPNWHHILCEACRVECGGYKK